MVQLHCTVPYLAYKQGWLAVIPRLVAGPPGLHVSVSFPFWKESRVVRVYWKAGTPR